MTDCVPALQLTAYMPSVFIISISSYFIAEQMICSCCPAYDHVLTLRGRLRCFHDTTNIVLGGLWIMVKSKLCGVSLPECLAVPSVAGLHR